MSPMALNALLHEIIFRGELAQRARDSFIRAWSRGEDLEMHRHFEEVLGHAARISLIFLPSRKDYDKRGQFLRKAFDLPDPGTTKAVAQLQEPQKQICLLFDREIRNVLFHADEEIQKFFDNGENRVAPRLEPETKALRLDGRFYHPAGDFIAIGREEPVLYWLGRRFPFQEIFQSIITTKHAAESILDNKDRYFDIKIELNIENRKLRHNKN